MAKKIIEKKLNEILTLLDVAPSVSIEETEENYKVVIVGDDLSFLIGHRGSSLNALQTLLSLIVFRELEEWKYINLNINDYRDLREERLKEMAKNFIDRVRFHREDVAMPHMNSYERRQVHMFISEYPDIKSESSGEGRSRHIVLKLEEGD